MSYLIKETTKEERERIVAESLGNNDVACDGCSPGIVKMYQDYIDGKMELKDVNMAFQARYVSGGDGPEKGNYRNYIFDLYGTLIDIHTDEQKPSVWRKLSLIYAAYGAEYSWQEMRDAYLRIAQEEEQKLAAETGYQWPEIRLETVFKRMFLEKASSGLPEEINEKTWLHVILNTFRCYSRERFSVYPGTVEKLEELKKSGCRIFLLSNAQASFTKPEIEVAGLIPYFEAMYLSSDYRMRKPQLEFLEKVLQEYKLDPTETVMVGNDVSSDIKIADECRIDSILLNTWHDTEEEIRRQFSDNEIGAVEKVRLILSGEIRELSAAEERMP